MKGLNDIRISLRNKLLILVTFIIVLCMMIQGTITMNTSSKSLTDSVNNQLISISSDVANQISGWAEKEFTTLTVLADIDDIKDPSVSLEEKAKILTDAVLRMDSSYENLGFYDIEGNTITRDGKKLNLMHRDYIKNALRGEKIIIDPVFSDITKSTLTQFGVPVYDFNNQLCGCIMLIIKGNPLLQIIKKIDLGDGMHPAIVNRKTGETIANTNPTTEDEGTNVGQLDPDSGLAKVLGLLMSGATGAGDFIDPFTNVHIISSYRPIEGTDWSVFCAAPYDYYFKGLNFLKKALLISLIASIIAAAILCSIIITILIKPLKVVKAAVLELASGNADLTKRIPDATNDEIGDVVLGVNGFIEKLQDIVGNLKNSQSSLSVLDEDLQASTQDASACITQISANIDHVNDQIADQIGSVTETAGAVNEIASNIESLEHMIEKQSSGVAQASSAVEQMIGNINSVNSAVEKMVASFTLLEKNTTTGINIQNDANEKIKHIEAQSKLLQDANMAIANIAEQTNLLAMNAAIEAAHAGEAGKGFSVVADEIRKLSETSSTQSKTIGDELKNIQNTIETVVQASSNTTAAFTSVSTSITDTSMIIQQIKGAMEEQQIGSKQIIDVLQIMNDSTSEVKSAGAEMAEGNKQILSEIQKLQNASDIMKGSMQEMAAGTLKMNETGAALSDISGKVTDSIKVISEEIDQFKI